MILFGDILGINLLLQTIDLNKVKAIVGASIRPQYWKELQKLNK